MAKYRVYMQQVVGTSVVVEADDPTSAIEAAFEKGVPGLMFLDNSYPDEGEWMSPSEMAPDMLKPEDDVELIEED